jgi:hypothetical protein
MTLTFFDYLEAAENVRFISAGTFGQFSLHIGDNFGIDLAG